MRTKKIVLLLVLLLGISEGREGMSLTMRYVYKACENNMPTACFELGELYREGTGVDKNLSVAEGYYNKSCDGGFKKGCIELEKLKKCKLQ